MCYSSTEEKRHTLIQKRSCCMTIDAAFTGFPSLTTNRLFLRQIQPTDTEDLFATFSDEEAMQFYEHERAFWGRGVMTEAMSAILTYGFDFLGLHRVEAIIDIANERSKGLLLKLGFTYEGNLRQRYFFRDRFEDEHYFGLLKDEWL